MSPGHNQPLGRSVHKSLFGEADNRIPVFLVQGSGVLVDLGGRAVVFNDRGRDSKGAIDPEWNQKTRRPGSLQHGRVGIADRNNAWSWNLGKLQTAGYVYALACKLFADLIGSVDTTLNQVLHKIGAIQGWGGGEGDNR